jgi:hypothetical protein
LLVAMVLAGCKGKARLTTDKNQVGGTLDVTVTVNPPTSGKLRFKGNAALEKLGDVEVKPDGKAVVAIPLREGTPGKNTVTMTFEGEGRGLAKSVGGTGTFDFDNTAPQTLRMVGVAWTGTKVKCTGLGLCWGQEFFVGDDAKTSVELADCDGCTLDGGGKTTPIHGASAAATIDFTDAVGAAAMPVADFTVPFKVTTREGRTLDAPFVTSSSNLLAIVLGRVASGPLHFASDGTSSSHHGAAIVDTKPFGVVATSGDAEHVSDIDVVGIASARSRVVETCMYVRKSDPNRTPVKLDHRVKNYDVTLYDRRTAKKLGHRVFQPTDVSCADSLEGDANATWSFPDTTQMGAWAKTFLK